MILIPIPFLPQMSPTATDVLAAEVAQFVAGRHAGEDLPAWVIAADRPAHPIHVYLRDDPEERAQQVAIATAAMAGRDGAREALWVCDVYISLRSQGSRMDTAPSEDPAATEALMLAYATHDGAWTVSVPYRRGDRGELTWQAPEFGWIEVGVDVRAPIVSALYAGLRHPIPLAPEMAEFGIDLRPRIDPRSN